MTFFDFRAEKYVPAYVTPGLEASAVSVAVYVCPTGTGAHDPSGGLGSISFGFAAQATVEL